MPQRLSRLQEDGIANPHLSYTKGDDVAYFFEEEFDVEVLVAEGRKVKANNEVSRAKPEYAAYRSAYRSAYSAKNKEILTAKVLARRIAAAATRLNSGDWSE